MVGQPTYDLDKLLAPVNDAEACAVNGDFVSASSNAGVERRGRRVGLALQKGVKARFLATSLMAHLSLAAFLDSFGPVLGFLLVDVGVDELAVAICPRHPGALFRRGTVARLRPRPRRVELESPVTVGDSRAPASVSGAKVRRARVPVNVACAWLSTAFIGVGTRNARL